MSEKQAKKKKRRRSSGNDEEVRKSAVTVTKSDQRRKEAAGIAIAAGALLLLISLLGKAGALGNGIKFIFFGVFGAPVSFGLVAVFAVLAFCMLRGSSGEVFRFRNVVMLVFFILFTSAFIFTVAEKETTEFAFLDMLKMSWNTKLGGVLDGMMSLTLQNLVDRPATFIIIITGMLVFAILLFSISLVKFFKWIYGAIAGLVSKGKRISKRFSDDNKKKRGIFGKNRKDGENGEKDNKPAYTITDGGKTVYDPETGEIISETGISGRKNDTPAIEGPVTGEQLAIPLDGDEGQQQTPVYVKPPIDLLAMPETTDKQTDTDQIQANAEKLEETMRSFGVSAKVINVSVGPNIIRYELQPQAGVKVNQITSLANDIALNLATKGSVRIEAPIPGKAAIGIEVPNDERRTVYLREIIDSPLFQNSRSPLTVCLGKDVEGQGVIADIKKMPHLLIAGTTGSGKSILLNSIIVSLLYKSSPEDVRMILLDPKIVELSSFNGIPHLLTPVVTDSKKAAGALSWAVAEMERRYETFSQSGEREIEQYNEYALANGLQKLPHIVIVIDELADLMAVAKDAVENSINRLAAKARAAGIHLVIATQRPSVNVLTGTIKANIPVRISLYVSSYVDSKTVLDCAGAEKLLGRGDMLYMPGGKDSIRRIQCAYCEKEIKEIVKFLQDNLGTQYDSNVNTQIDSHTSGIEKGGRDFDPAHMGESGVVDDEYLEQAVRIGLQYKKISASFLQTKLGIGFQRATRIVQWMEENGIVSARDGNNSRTILIESIDDYYRIRNSGGTSL